MNIGQKIKDLRLEKGLSQKEIADKIGVTQQVFTLWENGKHEPKASYIYNLAIFFGVSSDYLLGLENEDGSRNGHIIKDSFNIQGNGNNIKF